VQVVSDLSNSCRLVATEDLRDDVRSIVDQNCVCCCVIFDEIERERGVIDAVDRRCTYAVGRKTNNKMARLCYVNFTIFSLKLLI
jgi:hypothetical protein